MPVEPLSVDLSGGRTITLTPAAKGFPEVVRLLFDDGQGHKRVFADFKISSTAAARTVERELNMGVGEFSLLTTQYLEWSAAMVDVMLAEGDAASPQKPTPPYGLTQRTITQPRAEALSYDSVNSAGGLLAVLKRKGLADDTLLEWPVETLPYLVCLDLDFHNPEALEIPDDREIERLGTDLSPSPACWWRTQGGGLHAIYTAASGDAFTAEELAVGAAAKLLMTVSVLRGKGTVELKRSTRHPGALQKNKPCGPLILTIPNEEFDVLARFSRSEATEAEAAEIMEQEGFELGQRLAHSYCLLDPHHVSSSGTPIYVSAEGLFCHSCYARLGRGLMSWGYIRKHHGMAVAGERSLTPIREAFENFVHVEHVDYLFAGLFPTLPTEFRRLLYSAQLKKTHGADPRVTLAFKPFFFVRGLDGWLHADTLLPVGKPLAAADVSILPSCVTYVEDEEEGGKFSPVQASLSVHTNNGRVPGWVPILSFQFEPIYFVHNEAAESADKVRCYPRRRTTRDRVSYIPPKNRMPIERAEQVITDYFPGINMLYVKALMIAAGCAESGVSGVPMLWATGPTEAAKTTTIRVVTEMYGESFQNLSGVKEDRLDQLFGEAMTKTRLLVFDDFAKVPAEYQRMHTFVIRLNRGGHTFHKLFVGGTTPPLDNAIIFTDWRVPAFFSQDPQFGRRVHLLRLENRIPIGWDKIGHTAEDWWKKTPELTQAALTLHSWLVDTYFPDGDAESFSVKMTRLGVPKLEDEAMNSDMQGAVQDLVQQLLVDIAAAESVDGNTQRRVGRGARFIDWNNKNLGATCKLLIDSMGKGVSSREPERTYNVENLKHVLDPFQLHFPKLYDLSEGVATAEFELRAWGEMSYIRVIEAGRSHRSCIRKVNEELFPQWPPVPKGSAALVPASVPALAVDPDSEEIFVVDDEIPAGPYFAYLDFETQSVCDLRKHGATVYAQHPSTRVMCAAIIVGKRRIFWTEKQFDLTMPAGTEYEHGVGFLRDMVTDPAGCVIVAHNSSFERSIWTYTLKLPAPAAWRDTMDKTLSLGLPAGADEAGLAILKLGKDVEGQAFIRKFWGPNKKTGELPELTSYILQGVLNYNFRDTDISHGIAQKHGLDMVPAWEQSVCELHHKINDWGIHVDREFAATLRDFDQEFKALSGEQVERITTDPTTGIPAVTRADLTRNDFLRAQLNLNLPADWQLDNMRQTSLEEILSEAEEDPDLFDPTVIEVIKCRLTATRAALAKVDKAIDCISADGRAKAQLRYCGAATGRWSGYQIQPQNMKRPSEDFDLMAAIEAVENKDREKFVGLCKGQPPYELLGSLIRGVLTPAPGNTYVVGDFASIEARAILWLAGDEEGLKEYRRKDAADEAHPDGKDPNVPDSYQILAGDSIFGKNPIAVTKKERGGGKIGVLACGFGGGAAAVERMALPLGVDLAAIGKTPQDIVDAYRTKYPKVKAYWYACEAAFRTVLTSRRTTTQTVGVVTFRKLEDRVEIILPSGRPITYMNARLEADPLNQGRDRIVYDNAVRGKTLKRHTYGGKIAENIVQAFCRDLLADVMLRVDAAGASIAFHVHDEAVLEVLAAHAAAWCDWLKTCMRTAPLWAKGMPVFSVPELMTRYGK